MSSPPNVLLITTDMQRRDTLGCFAQGGGANALIRTPHLIGRVLATLTTTVRLPFI